MAGSWSWRCAVVACLVVPVLGAAHGCRRGEVLDGTPLYAPFNQRKPVAVATVRIANGRGELLVRNVMDGRLALRIEEISLRAPDAAGLVWRPVFAECVLAGRAHLRFVEDVPGAAAGAAEVRASAIPIDDPGRSIYREWVRLRRPTEIAAIDTELARLSTLPPCPVQ